MRAIVVLILVGLMVPAPAMAQEPTALLEDPEGDESIYLFDGNEVPEASGTSKHADLRALWIEETPEDLIFTVAVTQLDAATEFNFVISTHFEFEGRQYRLDFFRSELISPGFRVFLQEIDSGTGFSYVLETWDATVDSGENSVTAEVPRSLIAGLLGDTPRPGTSLENIHVMSQLNNILGIERGAGVGSVYDTMGESSPASIPIQFGLEQTGHARLGSATPFRVSNGEASTFVYEVEATNIGDERDIFGFKVVGAPSNWEVTLPAQSIRLDAGEMATIPVVVRTAFIHSHGSSTAFQLEMKSETDSNSVGRIELGIRYPEVPQPAGHHDRLWIQTHDSGVNLNTFINYALSETLLGSGDQDFLTMNAMQDDASDDNIPVKGNWCGTHQNGTTGYEPIYCWPTYLAPGLEMGLDFDVSREGSIEVTVQSVIPAPHRITGTLMWQGPTDEPSFNDPFGFFRESMVLATLEGDWVDVPLNGQANLVGRIIPTPDSDLVAFQPGAALLLNLQVAVDRPENFFLGPRADKPDILPGGTLQLPLFEYEDPVGDIFDAGGFVSLTAEAQEKLVNPGKTVVYNITIEHLSPRTETFRARLVGSNEIWGSVLGSDRIKIPGNGTTQLSVAVAAPEDAVDGDRADLLLEVASTEDLDGRGLIRLLTTVDVDAEHPDESLTAKSLDKSPSKKSPGAPALALLVALGCIAALRRRG